MSRFLGTIFNKIHANLPKTPGLKCTRFTSTNLEKDFEFVGAQPQDFAKILSLLWTSFHPYEPTTAALGLGNKVNPFLDDDVLAILSQGHTIIARCRQSGKIAGASLNGTVSLSDINEIVKMSETISCPQTRKWFEFWAHVQKAPRLHEKMSLDKIFAVRGVVVDEEFKMVGLHQKLVEETKEYAKNKGFPLVRMDVTSDTMAKTCKALNMKQIYELFLQDYVGPDKEPIIKTERPNASVKVFVETNWRE